MNTDDTLKFEQHDQILRQASLPTSVFESLKKNSLQLIYI